MPSNRTSCKCGKTSLVVIDSGLVKSRRVRLRDKGNLGLRGRRLGGRTPFEIRQRQTYLD